MPRCRASSRPTAKRRKRRHCSARRRIRRSGSAATSSSRRTASAARPNTRAFFEARGQGTMSGYDEALLKRARAARRAERDDGRPQRFAVGAARRLRPPPCQVRPLREPQGHIKIPKLRHQYLHTDFPRCRKGGLTAQFWSCLRADDDPRRRGATRHEQDQITPSRRRASRCRFEEDKLEQIDCVHRLCENSRTRRRT